MRPASGHRLEVDVVLEKGADQPPEAARILPQRGVLELHDVDLPGLDLAVDEPQQVLARELADRMRAEWTPSRRPAVGLDQELDRGADPFQALVGGQFVRVVQQRDQVQVHKRASSRSVWYMNTPPPCTGGKTG